jgi:hypothetical protein
MLMTAGLTVGSLELALGQQIHRNGFEIREPVWVKGTADAPFRELVHDITDATAHTGQSAEHLQISSEPGSYIYYYYSTGRAPISDDLSISFWVKANRPGVQLLARLVLPKERNPTNLDEPLTTLLRGDLYQPVSRWQRLELRRPAKQAKQQQQIMRSQLKRDVDFTDAYIDRILLNVYAGPGLTEVWIDDLEVGPVLETTPAVQPNIAPAPGGAIGAETVSRPAPPIKLLPPGDTARKSSRNALVEMDRGQLLVNGKPFFFRGIRHSDTPLETLRDAGFNTIWFDPSTPPALVEEAVTLGFWLVPTLPLVLTSVPVSEGDTRVKGSGNDPASVSVDELRQDITRFLERDNVLFWDVGGGLTEEEEAPVMRTVSLVHAADPQRPVGADAWDGLRPYSRNLDLLGTHRWPLMTGLELPQYRLWLNQRRLLARQGAFLWTWIQTHLPDWYTGLVYNRPGSAAFEEPVGPQPEQIRLLTYTALAAGCRGLGFWSDRFLADSHQGRDRLLTVALLNLEMKMLEPLLVAAAQEPSWIDTSDGNVKAAVLRTEHGILVLPIWMGKGAQFVPGQAAISKLSITVPQVPASTQAWEISPGSVHALKVERTTGGTKITLPEFGLTAAVLFAADQGNRIVARLQDQARQTNKTAAKWAHDLAEEEIRKVARIQEQLEQAGHTLPDGQQLMGNARQRLQKCTELLAKGDYREADAEGQRVLRPLRILMRNQWLEAKKELEGLAVASPYTVSFFTLPQHWRFLEQIRQLKPGANVLPGGDFELSPDQIAEGWLPQESALASDEVTFVARRVATKPKEGRQCLMLQILPKGPPPVPAALERAFLAINSPSVHLPPGTLVRISAWISIPGGISTSVDGALFYDSAGGEPLAVRQTDSMPWRKFTLYRWVPPSGTINVTLALTGLGTVYFDDVRIEPLTSEGTATVKESKATR